MRTFVVAPLQVTDETKEVKVTNTLQVYCCPNTTRQNPGCNYGICQECMNNLMSGKDLDGKIIGEEGRKRKHHHLLAGVSRIS